MTDAPERHAADERRAPLRIERGQRLPRCQARRGLWCAPYPRQWRGASATGTFVAQSRDFRQRGATARWRRRRRENVACCKHRRAMTSRRRGCRNRRTKTAEAFEPGVHCDARPSSSAASAMRTPLRTWCALSMSCAARLASLLPSVSTQLPPRWTHADVRDGAPGPGAPRAPAHTVSVRYRARRPARADSVHGSLRRAVSAMAALSRGVMLSGEKPLLPEPSTSRSRSRSARVAASGAGRVRTIRDHRQLLGSR